MNILKLTNYYTQELTWVNMLQSAPPSHILLNTSDLSVKGKAGNEDIMENEIVLIALIWHIASS